MQKDQSHKRDRVLLATNVRGFRKAMAWTQEELAERADLHINHVSAIERGMKNVSLSTVTQLAEAFGVPISTLFEVGPESLDSKNPKASKP